MTQKIWSQDILISFQYQHITNGITYYCWKNMFHIQSSPPVKDLCYIDQTALHMSSCEKQGEKEKQQQRIPWKLRVDSHCDT